LLNYLAGNGNRRQGLDRRVFSYFAHIPERRSGKENEEVEKIAELAIVDESSCVRPPE